MPGLRHEAGPVPEMFEVQGRPLLLRRVPEVRLAVPQADVQALCRSWYAGVAFCWAGVGAVLSIFVVIACVLSVLGPEGSECSRVAASRSFRRSRLARVYPSVSAARSPGKEDDACWAAAVAVAARNSCVYAIFTK